MSTESAVAVALGLIARQIETNHRDTTQRIDRFEDNVNKRLDAQDAQLEEFCDRGVIKHAEIDRRFEQIAAREAARAHQAEGRRQLVAPVLGFVRDQGVGIVLGLLPFVAYGTFSALSPQQASAHNAAPVSTVVDIPPTGKAPLLRGRLDAPAEAWQEPRRDR